MKDRCWIEAPSDVGAGKRGASLGIDALYMEAFTRGIDLFQKSKRITTPISNSMLWDMHPTFEEARFGNNVLSNCEAVRDTVHEVLQGNSFPWVLAGDHSTAAGTIAGVKKWAGDKKVGVVWIDAHADLHSPYTSPSGNMHGMPMGATLGINHINDPLRKPSPEASTIWEKMKNMSGTSPCVNPSDVIYIGARDTQKQEDAIFEHFGIPNLTTDDIRLHGVQWALNQVQNRLQNCDVVYITFDVDSMDPAFSDGTGTPVPNGLAPQQVALLLKNLIYWDKTACFEIVEINPLLDTKNEMANRVIDILLDVDNSNQ